MTAPALVQKLWNYCNILRDDALSYGDSIGGAGRTGFLVSPLRLAISSLGLRPNLRFAPLRFAPSQDGRRAEPAADFSLGQPLTHTLC
jgi:hypothetical protein